MTDKESEKNWKEIISRIESASQHIAEMEKGDSRVTDKKRSLFRGLKRNTCRKYFSGDGCKK